MSDFSRQVFFFLYRWFLWPLLKTSFRTLALVNEKIRRGLEMRKATPSSFNGGQVTEPWLACETKQNPIWIHCASGEFEYAKPVIFRLKGSGPDAMPGVKILVTYFSPSIAKTAQAFKGVDFACPLPWDEAESLKRFIAWHQPRALLIARTDTWPEMLRQAHQARIPSLLFSATLPAESGRARGLGRWMSRAAFSYLDAIYCVSDEDRRVFASLGFADRTETRGDTRYDQVIARLQSPKPLREEIFAGVEPKHCFVAGSTWDEDEEVLIAMADKTRSWLRVILVPHEPTPQHLQHLEARLQAMGLASVRYSSASRWPEATVLLIDQIGILAELYLRGRFAFVGGSFRKTVHSVMEPLAAGCLTFVGPLHLNNREAIEFKGLKVKDAQGLTCVESVASASEMVVRLERAKALPPSARDGLPGAIQSEIQSRSGKSKAVAKWCRDLANRTQDRGDIRR